MILTVTDAMGEIGVDQTTANIVAAGGNNQPPLADVGGPYTGVVGSPVAFDGTGSTDPDGTIEEYNWNFGDQTGPSFEESPSHIYASEGTYTVSLTVTDDDGDSSTNEGSVTTATIAAAESGNLPPVADANGPYTGETNVALVFDGSGSTDPDGNITGWVWDFGDGDTGFGETTSHIYTQADTYNVTLTVTDDDSDSSSIATQAFIDQGELPPVADAGGPYGGSANVEVNFDGTASKSSNPGGSIVQYDWDYGDGVADLDAGATPSHIYTANGLYEVTLTVTDEVGGTDVDTTSYNIFGEGETPDQPPIADANGPYTGTVLASITFDGTASVDPDGDIVSWSWNFGDGNVDSSGPTPSHVYTSSGRFVVTLRVEDDDGLIDTNKAIATIGVGNLPPLADANGPYVADFGATISFDGNASEDPDGTIVSWDWRFGDGTTGSGPTPTHTYGEAGIYLVVLTVTDDQTVTDSTVTAANILPVNPPPTALAAASLPSSRSVQVGSLASAFATIINTGSNTAFDCSLAPQTSVAADFAYQTTDASNVPVGTPNTPVDIAAGGSQNFIFGFLPTAPISPTEVQMTYDCTGSDPAPVTVGLNTLLLSASTTPVADIVALAATPTADGIVDLPGTNGSNAFAVSTVNVGSTDTITASPRLSTTLPLVMSICETNPATGACLSAPTSSTTSSVAGGATPTYSVFVTGTGTVPFDPANNRIIVEFKDADGEVRGSTSVAVRTL